MQLVLLDTPTEIAQRLASKGWSGACLGTDPPSSWQALASMDAAEALNRPRVWLSAAGRKPTLATDDVLLDTTPAAAATQTLGLRWQGSPFAVAHGFLLTVGGPAALIPLAAPLLDALAPNPGAWLHAGGLSAPAFFNQVMEECGGGLAGLAPLFLSNPATGLDPFWQGQKALSARLAELAQRYLAGSGDEDYHPINPLPAVFSLTPPNSVATDSPARKLAALLLWLHQQKQAAG
ncbi:hypothetical protein [Chitinimonas naiadis]